MEAKLLEPVFAFDREVIPAGTVVQGDVSRTQPIGKWQRVRAIVSGDFTPLRSARVEFTTLILPDGHKLATHTIETMGLNSIYTEPRKNQKAQPQNQNGGILGTAKQTAKDRVNSAIDSVRGPNKKEKLIDLLWSKLPYRPQYVRRGTRFDAALQDPLQFGFEPVKQVDLTELGSQPLPDSVVHARLLTALSSASAKQGDAVEAVVTAPLFSPAHKLVLPEGARLTGTVVVARKARFFHRGGQLRFSFQKIDLPEEVANLRFSAPEPTNPTAPKQTTLMTREPMKTQAVLEAAEGSGKAQIKVDSEGGVQAKESKTRFIAPLISLMVASRAADNDHHHDHDADDTGVQAGAGGNVSGRTLGGGLGLGMLGAAVSQSSPYVGMAFGYYGLAWSVYSHVVARGGEVQFDKNAMMDIKFSTRTPPQGSKIRATLERALQGGGLPR
ncbi:MAG TPA: hypothetical protein VE959_31655 [Bryobacteraceae bacterium]|nr:hypothetical protein [Bryobacteraceae bacterium]